jgi:hypothetical protein
VADLAAQVKRLEAERLNPVPHDPTAIDLLGELITVLAAGLFGIPPRHGSPADS